MGQSKIEWTEMTWNPVAGCTKCSPGCDNCYAERMALRLAAMECAELEKHLNQQPARNSIIKYTPVVDFKKKKWNGKVFCHEKALDQPRHWKKPRIIFVCSMSDLFHPKVPFGFIDKVRQVMRQCPQHTFLILTKRIKRLYEYCEVKQRGTWPKNIHLGVSICTQKEADEKIPISLQIPGFDWISAEPLLEEIDFQPYCDDIAWFVLGCESGPKRRRVSWEDFGHTLYSIDSQSAIFVKQIEIASKVEHDMNKFPEWARIREYPQ